MPDTQETIIIVGGGWAGLACAVELTRLGHAVTVLESARQLGGRARRVAFNAQTVDNGQHAFVGAYHQTLSLLEYLGISQETALHRQALELNVIHSEKQRYQLQLPHIPSPLNLLWGLLNSKGFTLKDRWRALAFGLRLFTNSLVSDQDVTVAELFDAQRQTRHLVQALWEPICLATLNTPIEEASAQVFLRVLHDSFCRSFRDADMIIPCIDLGSLLPDKAFDYIEQHNGFVHLSQRVSELIVEQDHITGIKVGDKLHSATQVVLATPPHITQALLKPHDAAHDIAYNLSGYGYYPICTVYLQYPPSVRLDRPLQGLLGTTTQWVIDRHMYGQPGLIAAVISGPGQHMQLDNEQLAAHIQDELQQHFPHWPIADAVMVIREKRATFSCRAGINHLRPANRTHIRGLWLAGDYTNTGYPATIESAVISGQQSAQLLHQEVIKA